MVAIRTLKSVLAAFIALLALMYATQNIVNLDAAFYVTQTVMSMQGHEYYAKSFGPAISQPLLVWAALGVIIATEYAAGIFAALGAWDLWQARKGSAAQFNGAKHRALLGAGLGVVVWLGLFGVIGGAYFQMWQTDLGASSLAGALQYFLMCAVVLVFINMHDE